METRRENSNSSTTAVRTEKRVKMELSHYELSVSIWLLGYREKRRERKRRNVKWEKIAMDLFPGISVAAKETFIRRCEEKRGTAPNIHLAAAIYFTASIFSFALGSRDDQRSGDSSRADRDRGQRWRRLVIELLHASDSALAPRLTFEGREMM